jgi:hypothetical protein
VKFGRTALMVAVSYNNRSGTVPPLMYPQCVLSVLVPMGLQDQPYGNQLSRL